ncbi:hypothetical protein [Brevundimonas sp.]|uniref:hypothetical protein n=1 Tax=Brevundimonas sp. TaxID=1871086 RepID=UPI002C6E901E|nr:hypothetical protein [Brevundimonas sp.]HWQ85410.1 hypothetical protein [Brevundimonas sp.]
MIRRLLAIAAVGLLLAAFAGPGDPIPGVEVGLEHDPEGLISPRTTDDLGRAEFAVGEGRAVVLFPAVQTLRRPAVARVEVGRTVQVSAPIVPGGRGRADILGTDGRRLVVIIPRGGDRVRVTLAEVGSRTTAPSAPGGESGSETGEARATVSQSGGVIAAEASAPVNGIGGTGGGRMSNRGQSENGEPPATVNSSGGPIDIESWSWGRIDRLNTVQACTARRGVVLMHEGVQQCRLPATTRQEGAVRP